MKEIRTAIIAKKSEKEALVKRCAFLGRIRIVDTITPDSEIDVVLISPSGYYANSSKMRPLKKQHKCVIIGITSASGVGSFYENIEAGEIDDIIPIDRFLSNDLLKILESAIDLNKEKIRIEEERLAATAPKKKRAAKARKYLRRVVSITGDSATGKSSLTINLALAVAKDGYKVMILDADLQKDSIDIMLDVPKKKTILDIVANEQITGIENIAPYMSTYKSIDFIATPIATEDADLVPPETVHDIIEICRDYYDFIFVDTSTYLSDVSGYVMEASTEVLVLAKQTSTSAKYAFKLFGLLKQIASSARFYLVMVETGVPSYIEASETEKIVGQKIFFTLPADLKRIDECINLGKPMLSHQKRSDYSTRVGKMAKILEAMAKDQYASEEDEMYHEGTQAAGEKGKSALDQYADKDTGLNSFIAVLLGLVLGPIGVGVSYLVFKKSGNGRSAVKKSAIGFAISIVLSLVVLFMMKQHLFG